MTARSITLALLSALAMTPQAAAQDAEAQVYPNRAVRIVVPFPAGGPTDIVTRVVAQRLSETWGQAVVVENQPGANTAIAAARVAKMPADGYTLFAVMDVTMVLNPITSKTLPYDPLKDFAPITLASKNTSLLSVRTEDGPRTVQELIARAKANPGKLNYGAGIITTRLAGYLFNVEAGIPALDDISTWIGFVAPAGTPRGIIDKVQREVVRMYADPVIADKLEKSGISTASSTPEEMSAFVRKELERWGQVFKDSGIQLN